MPRGSASTKPASSCDAAPLLAITPHGRDDQHAGAKPDPEDQRRILVLDGCGVEAVISLLAPSEAGLTVAGMCRSTGHKDAGSLAAGLAGLLQGAPVRLIAAVTGPGSFTGLRATLALAHGLALGWSVPLAGVPAADALRRSVGPSDLPVWCVIGARAGHVHLQRPDDPAMRLLALEQVPVPQGRVRLAGDAVPLLAGRLPDAECSPVRRVEAAAVAALALDRQAAGLAPLPAQPLYAEPPRVSRPTQPPRPPPA